VKVDRILRFPSGYPVNYGFITSTLDEDGDPIDVIILCDEPLHPLSLVVCKPIGLLNMMDTGKRDDKILSVIKSDPLFGEVKPELLIRVYAERFEELKYFFEHYKEMEPNRWIEVKGWESAEKAKRNILSGIELFRSKIAVYREP
jgi:inorganic pyrophosphatase